MKGQLIKFIKYVNEETKFFQDENVTYDQVVDTYLKKHQTQKARDNFNKIYDLLENRLNEPGLIRAAHAWDICAGHGLCYATVCVAFRDIMTTMIEQGKVQKASKHGTYMILKPNSKTY